MTAAVTIAKSKTGRKLVGVAIVCVIGAGMGLLMFLIIMASVISGILIGNGGSSSGSVSSAGTVSISFSQIEPAESAYALAHIPATQTSPSTVTFPILYAAATQNGACVMPWPILAGVANEESTFGTSRSAGVAGGSNSAGAEGPLQFEPATFAAYANPAPAFPGASTPPSLYDAVDAAFAAARKLCSAGVVTDPQFALWTYNAGLNGVTFQLINGQYTPVYNDSMFQGSSDNPARYVSDVLANAALYGGGQVAGSSIISVTGLAPGSGDLQLMQERSVLWMGMLGSSGGASCEQTLQVPCFDAMPTILQNYDGIALPSGPTAMQQDLAPVSTPKGGDIVLFGSYQSVKIKSGGREHYQNELVINPNTYAVVVNASNREIALVGSDTIQILQLPGPLTEGMQIQGMTVQVIGSPF